MNHIGIKLRKIRKQKGLSVEKVVSRMSKKMTRQAYEYRERTGFFEWDTVLEVCKILGYDPEKFLLKKAN